ADGYCGVGVDAARAPAADGKRAGLLGQPPQPTPCADSPGQRGRQWITDAELRTAVGRDQVVVAGVLGDEPGDGGALRDHALPGGAGGVQRGTDERGRQALPALVLVDDRVRERPPVPLVVVLGEPDRPPVDEDLVAAGMLD